ncbi:ileal sodium/bile acid cotransporter-like [Babylonia areolata]|uniref:ileal sodium/bile acid cotransporter-like n=1 Tax=Babylonia areolata TaxID=304850 RepID=UPI003FD1CC90
MTAEQLTLYNNQTDKIIDIGINTTTEGLAFPVPPGVVVMAMDSERVFEGNYTLRCPNKHAHYVLEASLDQIYHQRTAVLTSPVSVNISCQQGSQLLGENAENSAAEGKVGGGPVVFGTFHVHISTELIGKAVLLFYLGTLHDGEMSHPSNLSKSAHEPSSESIKSSEPVSNSLSNDGVTEPSSPPSSSSSSPSVLVHRTVLLVLRKQRLLDVIFRISSYVIVVAVTASMGCTTDMKVVKEVLRRPLAPAIGFCCQYVCMPLIAYGVARSVNVANAPVSFGIFACGLCPGGGISNMYTYLLGGDISLSITLTVISTMASLGMMPFWLFTLGSTLESGSGKISIPYLKIVETLATIILPLFLGLFIQYRLPRVAVVIIKALKPVYLVTILYMLVMGVYSNLYIFRLFDLAIVLAGCLLPYLGYVVGGVISFALRLPWLRVKTIALETGIQNTAIAFLIVIFSLPAPEGELAAVAPPASGIMATIPPLVLSLFYGLFKKYRAKGREATAKECQEMEKKEVEEKEEEEKEEEKEQMMMLEKPV